MLQRFLDPATLASISSLDLVAKTVVDGFVAGLHRSPSTAPTPRETTCATSIGTSSPVPTAAS